MPENHSIGVARDMVEFRNMDGGGMPMNTEISDGVVMKVGKAIGQIAAIRQAYKTDMAVAETADEKHELAQQVELQAVNAVSDQGLSIEQYNEWSRQPKTIRISRSDC